MERYSATKIKSNFEIFVTARVKRMEKRGGVSRAQDSEYTAKVYSSVKQLRSNRLYFLRLSSSPAGSILFR